MRVSGRSANAKHGFSKLSRIHSQTPNSKPSHVNSDQHSKFLLTPSIHTYILHTYIHTYIHTCIHTYTHILVSKCNLRSPLNSESLAPKPPVQFGGCGGDPRRVRAKADSMQGFHGRFRLLGFRAFGSVCGV